MYEYIKGELVSKTLDNIVIDNNGIGYKIIFAQADSLNLNQDYKIFLYQHIREDEQTLYGFSNIEQRDFFIKLISVKGLGPKTAINIFSKASYAQVISAIENNDVAFLKGMPGIGSKTASQIVLDLKGKLIQQQDNETEISNNVNDAFDALKALGYKVQELNKIKNLLIENQNLNSDELIKLGLKALNKF